MSDARGSDFHEDVEAHAVPRQSAGRHDAYDIYAQIFALRIDDAASPS